MRAWATVGSLLILSLGGCGSGATARDAAALADTAVSADRDPAPDGTAPVDGPRPDAPAPGDAHADTLADAQNDAQNDAEFDAQDAAQTDAQFDALDDAQTDAQDDVQTDAQTDAQDDAQTDAQADTQVDAQTDAQPPVAQAVYYGLGRRLKSGGAPRRDDGTDFGSLRLGGVPPLRRFTVVNRGTAPLTFDATTPIAVTGPEAAEFSVVEPPPASLAPGAHATFAVTFTPAALGFRQATLRLTTDDPATPVFELAIRGRGVDGTSITAPVTVAHGPGMLCSNLLIDLDGDGDLDLVSAPCHTPPTWWPVYAHLNDGAGDFTAATASVFPGGVPTTGSPYAQGTVADFTGDGIADVFIPDTGYEGPGTDYSVSHLLVGDGAGHLADESATRLPQERAFTHGAAWGDIDDDGDMDIYMANGFSDRYVAPRFFVNDGSGVFYVRTDTLPAFIDWGTHADGEKMLSAALVDVDLDGDLDLVLGSEGVTSSGTPRPRDTILLNDGTGGFLERAPDDTLPPRELRATIRITVADIDNDGWPDLVMHTTNDGGSFQDNRLFRNRGDGTFEDQSSRLPAVSDLRGEVYPLDFDADGRVDLLDAGGGEHGWLLHQEASGQFTVADTYTLNAGGWGYWENYRAGDLNGDGVDDVLRVVTVHGPSPGYIRPESVEIMAGDGTGILGIFLGYPAPSGGLTMELTSADPSVVSVSPQVTAPAGATRIGFRVHAAAGTPHAPVAITARDPVSGATATAWVTLVDQPRTLDVSDLIINEISYDVPGDADCDGSDPSQQDEFVEFVSLEPYPVTLAGVTVWSHFDSTKVFVFPDYVLGPGEPILLFGGPRGTGVGTGPWCVGATADHIGDAKVFRAPNPLGLDDTVDGLHATATGDFTSTFLCNVSWTSGSGSPASSLTMIPDALGQFAWGPDYHDLAPGHATDRHFTPGTQLDGTLFSATP